jgi:hypothetical protein
MRVMAPILIIGAAYALLAMLRPNEAVVVQFDLLN